MTPDEPREKWPESLDLAEVEAAIEKANRYARIRQELERSIEVLTGRSQTLERYEKEVLQPLPQPKEMAESAYRLGKSNLLELLDASRSRTDIHLNHRDMLLSEVEAEIEALNASGILVAPWEQAR